MIKRMTVLGALATSLAVGILHAQDAKSHNSWIHSGQFAWEVGQPLLQVLAGDELHDHIKSIVRHIKIVDLDDA